MQRQQNSVSAMGNMKCEGGKKCPVAQSLVDLIVIAACAVTDKNNPFTRGCGYLIEKQRARREAEEAAAEAAAKKPGSDVTPN